MKAVLLLLTLVVHSCQTAGQPEIRFSGFEYPPGLDMSYAIFELVNETSRPFTYHEQIGPSFATYDLGNPSPFDGWLGCGNGIEDRTILPGDRVQLTCYIDDRVGPIQIKMSVWSEEGQAVELSSPEVDVSQGKANRPVQDASPRHR